SELEVWKERDDGHYHLFKTYPICNWSGDLGPKLKQGDRQSPEGFYRVTKGAMNPNSSFHLSFNLGYPNRYDRANARTGQFLMVHGDCRSAGCYAITDTLIEELYAIAREAFAAGQQGFEVHAFPFRMTPENLKRHATHRWARFWNEQLRPAYDQFEVSRKVPEVAVCERRYLVNVDFKGRKPRRGDAQCPAYTPRTIEPFQNAGLTAISPRTAAISRPVRASGRKVRQFAAVMSLKPEPGRRSRSVLPSFGLTKAPSFWSTRSSNGSADGMSAQQALSGEN
ncbi:MAG: murein L,D-transpeptidase family protein, partial [Pseudomonadota bacterium]